MTYQQIKALLGRFQIKKIDFYRMPAIIAITKKTAASQSQFLLDGSSIPSAKTPTNTITPIIANGMNMLHIVF